MMISDVIDALAVPQSQSPVSHATVPSSSVVHRRAHDVQPGVQHGLRPINHLNVQQSTGTKEVHSNDRSRSAGTIVRRSRSGFLLENSFFGICRDIFYHFLFPVSREMTVTSFVSFLFVSSKMSFQLETRSRLFEKYDKNDSLENFEEAFHILKGLSLEKQLALAIVDSVEEIIKSRKIDCKL